MGYADRGADGERVLRFGIGVAGHALGATLRGVGRSFDKPRHDLALSDSPGPAVKLDERVRGLG